LLKFIEDFGDLNWILKTKASGEGGEKILAAAKESGVL